MENNKIAICDCGDTGKRDCPVCWQLWSNQKGPQAPPRSMPIVGIDTAVPR